MEAGDDQEAGDQEPDYRFTLANERTFLAWIRTSLALVAGGIAIVQLAPRFGGSGVREAVGVLVSALGGLLSVLAVRRWQAVQDAMRHRADLPPTRLPMLLGLGLVLVTLLVIGVLVVPMLPGQ